MRKQVSSAYDQQQGTRRSAGESGVGETDPLLLQNNQHNNTIRQRKSPLTTTEAAAQRTQKTGMNRTTLEPIADPYNDPRYYDATAESAHEYALHDTDDEPSFSTLPDATSERYGHAHPHAHARRVFTAAPNDRSRDSAPPLLEIPEEVYAVRKAALQVMKPLTSSWLVVSIGFALSVILGMARWTQLMPDLPYWFILLPSWGSHIGLLWCHIRSARALSKFIAEANENRQRPDSTDHIDRTEYLPLLQRSLKFGFKTGLLSFCTFVFEVLLYVRIANANRLPIAVVFIPLWILVVGAILDGIICKTQHLVRLFCWIMACTSMVLTVLRIDHDRYDIRWRLVLAPIVTILSIASGTLIYIIYGHQVGYYRLTESQLTAGILYSMSALICIVLVVVIGEVMPLSRPVEIETRILVVVMAPLVVTLTGMGAYSVSRDEFGRLLLYGGQAAVHPMKLRWETAGWTSVPTKGVTILPMFGEVSYRPLEKRTGKDGFELCACCACYPYEEEDDAPLQGDNNIRNHPYLTPPRQRPTIFQSHPRVTDQSTLSTEQQDSV
mmetsp:Transcript_5351/g.7472  ORF Transcript_5351/g.7472 Transcript_5351/m.7472 type:complete len:553 (-) Transcript_5351:297-1955(-)